MTYIIRNFTLDNFEKDKVFDIKHLLQQNLILPDFKVWYDEKEEVLIVKINQKRNYERAFQDIAGIISRA